MITYQGMFNITGRVKSILETTWQIKEAVDPLPGKVQEKTLQCQGTIFTHFNHADQKVEIIKKDDKDQVTSKVEYIYNGNDQLLELKNISPQSGEISTDVKYYYENGRLNRMEFFLEDYGLASIDIPVYNDKGAIVASESYNTKGEIGRTTLYEEDEKGNLVLIRTFHGKDKPNEEVWLEYDEQNRKVRQICINHDGCCPWNKTVFLYNENQDEAEEIRYYPSGEVYIHQINEYNYDEQGNWVEKRRYDNGILKVKVMREIAYLPVI